MPGRSLFQITLLLLFFGALCDSQPLSTSGRWIVDAASGNRVKLSCVNWVSHLQAMVAEGQDKKPLKDIAARVASLGFNCVRLTWATFMFTRNASLTVEQSLDDLGLKEAKSGIAKNNPSVLSLTHVEAFENVVDELGAHGLMVVLDNHVSLPKWCCASDDGNGFFGDEHFDPEEWRQGLAAVAQRFKGKTQVVGMSMRNELRGPRQNEGDWYRYIQRGASTIHEANPDVLVIVSGLSFDTDLGFLRRRPLTLKLNNKLVFEAHWYSFSASGQAWLQQPLNRVCADAVERFSSHAGFVGTGENPVPLFVSEFGGDQRGVNQADNRFLSCFFAFVAERDLDWALWTLPGSYYIKNKQFNVEETYGVLDFNWEKTRNPRFRKRFGLLQKMIQDPNSKVPTYHIMYHPQSGQCARIENRSNIIKMGNCRRWSRWNHDEDGAPMRVLSGTGLCLKAVGDGLPATLSLDCTSQQSAWQRVSSSKLHVAVRDERGGRYLCLEKNSSTILTRECVCLEDSISSCQGDPQSQWFKLVPANMK